MKKRKSILNFLNPSIKNFPLSQICTKWVLFSLPLPRLIKPKLDQDVREINLPCKPTHPTCLYRRLSSLPLSPLIRHFEFPQAQYAAEKKKGRSGVFTTSTLSLATRARWWLPISNSNEANLEQFSQRK